MALPIIWISKREAKAYDSVMTKTFRMSCGLAKECSLTIEEADIAHRVMGKVKGQYQKLSRLKIKEVGGD